MLIVQVDFKILHRAQPQFWLGTHLHHSALLLKKGSLVETGSAWLFTWVLGDASSGLHVCALWNTHLLSLVTPDRQTSRISSSFKDIQRMSLSLQAIPLFQILIPSYSQLALDSYLS